MKAIDFVYKIFRKFPFLLIANTALLIAVSLFGACSLLTISPVIDLLIHPDLQGVSPLTSRAIGILEFFGLPVTLRNWMIIFTIFVSLSSIFYVFARRSILRTVYAVLREIMMGTFEDFFNARWYFFSSSKQGMLLNTFTRELTVVSLAFGAIAYLFACTTQLILFLVIPFYLSWQVATISLSAALVFTLPFILLGKYSYRWGTLNTRTANQMTSVVQENFSLAKLITGFGNQHKSIESLGRAFDAHRCVTIKSQVLNSAVPVLYRPFGVIMIGIALFSARRFNVPLSETTVLLLSLTQVAVAISNVTMHKNSLENFSPSYEQIEALRHRAQQLKQVSGSRQFRGFDHELLIEGLSFAYPEHKPVLLDINVRVPKGKMVAFVGESGSGKSTFIDIILGFYQPTKGTVLIDEVPLQNFDIKSYRHRVGYVPQESVLFNTSIRDNLLWSKENATEREIKEACQQAHADEFIERLSQRYDTLVGNRGIRLSGGQVQRIALARAILRKPDILILDEATSSLDTHSERLIQQAIENIAKKTTIIIVAHRLSTIVNANFIYVFKKGRIIEEGTYAELIRMDGEFHRMTKLQVLETVS
ncbi:MAG: ABC transporter ATP-binding protein [Candidatus Omnitrophota bacterium]|nr:MAG: ABC transporter ATP-binding protein [Candidatus Omnitrophota bacterium]